MECYDPETDRWVVDVIPQMRYRRSGVGVAVLQGLLFAIGGYLEGKTSTDAVECYNPRTKRWAWLDVGPGGLCVCAGCCTCGYTSGVRYIVFLARYYVEKVSRVPRVPTH